MTIFNWQRASQMERVLAAVVCIWLIGCMAGFVVFSMCWPLVGDVTYLHYAVFLMHHGMVPYRDIVDMNLPATYMLERGVMAGFGPGAVGWRIYDSLLMAIAAASMLSILRPQGRLAGIFAASLFVMVHAQDGVIMSGERDFAVAVFLLAAIALVFGALLDASISRFGSVRFGSVRFGSVGLLLGLACNIKPTVVPCAVFLLVSLVWILRGRRAPVWPSLLAAIAGIIVPFATTLAFLVRYKAFWAFAETLRGLIAYHASLAHKSFEFLMGHSVAPLVPLVITWVPAAALLRARGKANAERIVLLGCAAGGLLSYLLQAKGFAYQRYPFLAFLLVIMAADFVRLARVRDAVRGVGVIGLLGGVIFSTIFLVRTAKFDRGVPERPLLNDLRALGVADGQVQCMDTAGPCIDSLYAGQIVQSTGFLYDCYMLDGPNPVALGLRKRFWQAMERSAPRLIVVTDSVCYDPAPSFNKFERWPEFSTYLAKNYTLAKSSGAQRPTRYWSRAVTPFAYRIYVRR